MSDFKQALGQFLTGELDFPGLERALGEALQSHPDAGPELRALINNLYKTGRLPHQLHTALAKHIDSRGAVTRPPPQQAPPQTGDAENAPGASERTQFKMPNRPDDDAMKTRLGAA